MTKSASPSIISKRIDAWRERNKRQKVRAAPASPANHAYPIPGSVSDPAAVAAQIVRAGQRARGELDDTTPSAPGSARPAASLAEQIVAAGRKRRGEAT
jgi:hypothetical protein